MIITGLVEEALRVLKAGGVIVLPTDTLYGLAALADRPEAVERIYLVKGRYLEKPLQLLLAKVEDIPQVAMDIPQNAWELAKALLPGALTLVLRKQASVPDYITAGLPTVAVRVPAHPLCQALIENLGSPLAATSANLSGYPSPKSIQEVIENMGAKVELILVGGPEPIGAESTILDLTCQPPNLLREGAVPRKVLEKYVDLSTDDKKSRLKAS